MLVKSNFTFKEVNKTLLFRHNNLSNNEYMYN